jgi:hypothetical protein
VCSVYPEYLKITNENQKNWLEAAIFTVEGKRFRSNADPSSSRRERKQHRAGATRGMK